MSACNMFRLDLGTSKSMQIPCCADRPALLETAFSSRLLFLLRNKNLKVFLDIPGLIWDDATF